MGRGLPSGPGTTPETGLFWEPSDSSWPHECPGPPLHDQEYVREQKLVRNTKLCPEPGIISYWGQLPEPQDVVLLKSSITSGNQDHNRTRGSPPELEDYLLLLKQEVEEMCVGEQSLQKSIRNTQTSCFKSAIQIPSGRDGRLGGGGLVVTVHVMWPFIQKNCAISLSVWVSGLINK